MKEQRVYFFQCKIITVKSGDSEEKASGPEWKTAEFPNFDGNYFIVNGRFCHFQEEFENSSSRLALLSQTMQALGALIYLQEILQS